MGNLSIMQQDKAVDVLFQIWNSGVGIFWILIMILPTWKLTTIMIRSRIIPFLFGIVYLTYMIISRFYRIGPKVDWSDYGGGNSTSGFFSPNGLIVGFTNKITLTGAWIHYLAFDFFVGSWIAEDARECGIPQIFVAPSLVLTLMLGPVGLIVYLICKVLLVRNITKERESFNKYENPKWLPNFKNMKGELLTLVCVWFGSLSFWKRALLIDKFKKKNEIVEVEKEESEKDTIVDKVEEKDVGVE